MKSKGKANPVSNAPQTPCPFSPLHGVRGERAMPTICLILFLPSSPSPEERSRSVDASGPPPPPPPLSRAPHPIPPRPAFFFLLLASVTQPGGHTKSPRSFSSLPFHPLQRALADPLGGDLTLRALSFFSFFSPVCRRRGD